MRAGRAVAALAALVLLGACAAGPGNAWTELSPDGTGFRLFENAPGRA